MGIAGPRVNSARVVLVADTHLGFDLPQHERVTRRRRGDDFFANYRRVLDHVVRTRPAALVHGGDFFFRSRVAPEIVNDAYMALSEVAEQGIPVVIAPGNHDRSRLPSSIWLGHPNIHVLERPRTVVLGGGDLRLAVVGFPFVRGDVRRRLPETLREAGMAEADAEIRLLCMHQTVEGARVGPNGYQFRAGPEVIPHASLEGGLTAVLAGHIHRAQTLERDGLPPVFYPGSIERTSFAERNEPKGFFDITFAVSGAREAVVAEADFVELPARPMVDVTLPATITPEDVGMFLRRAGRECPADAVVRVGSGERPEPAVVSRLTASLLRSCFPPTMNVQLSRALFNVFE